MAKERSVRITGFCHGRNRHQRLRKPDPGGNVDRAAAADLLLSGILPGRECKTFAHSDDIAQGDFLPGTGMIILTKINHAPIAVNSDLIEYIEETPDTVITLTNNEKVVVNESMSEIVQKVVQYRRQIHCLIEAEYERQQRNT